MWLLRRVDGVEHVYIQTWCMVAMIYTLWFIYIKARINNRNKRNIYILSTQTFISRAARSSSVELCAGGVVSEGGGGDGIVDGVMCCVCVCVWVTAAVCQPAQRGAALMNLNSFIYDVGEETRTGWAHRGGREPSRQSCFLTVPRLALRIPHYSDESTPIQFSRCVSSSTSPDR